MDHLAPPMIDVSNIDMWKLRISAYLKTLGLHVYLVGTKKSYLGNSKHIEANTQALMALRNTLNKEYLSMVSNCDSAFAVCSKLQTSTFVEDESSGESEQHCYMVQGNDSLEVLSLIHI